MNSIITLVPSFSVVISAAAAADEQLGVTQVTSSGGKDE